MTVELTPKQHDQIGTAVGEAIDVIDPTTRERYVLLSRERYDDLRDAIDQQNLRKNGLAALARRLSDGE